MLKSNVDSGGLELRDSAVPLIRENLPDPIIDGAVDSVELPEILKSCMDSGGFDPIDSAVPLIRENLPDPIISGEINIFASPLTLNAPEPICICKT